MNEDGREESPIDFSGIDSTRFYRSRSLENCRESELKLRDVKKNVFVMKMLLKSRCSMEVTLIDFLRVMWCKR